MMGAKLRSAINWFQSWLSQAKTTNPDNLLDNPPEEIIQEFAEKINRLAHPVDYTTSIQEALKTALVNWQQKTNSANSLVILGCPVEPIAEILQASLTGELSKELQIINPLGSWRRTTDASALIKVIREVLSSDAHQKQSEQQTLIVIPCLAQCFLRCIGGWEGIEFLQNAIVHDQSKFWLIGCNSWAWSFLNQVCQVSAYLEQVHYLPQLKGKALQQWLAPVTQALTPQDNEEDMSLAYSKSLASLSSGVSTVAAHLWLQRLRMRAADIPDAVSESQSELTNQDVTQEVVSNLQQTKPILPSLPDLTAIDRYLLHSLLLHGQITRTHLAFSLGESEQLVRSHVQMLVRAGVIIQQQEQLSLDPAYYPSLKTELSNNNFLIGKD
ncbi:MarR family transcriptional regulator [Nostocales cyanobacterium LEGE 11386]|nr:MarR family transcriptional regulator [Nostocales cyanobacterium LEGE 11386]